MNRKLFESHFGAHVALLMGGAVLPFFYCAANGEVLVGPVLVGLSFLMAVVLSWVVSDDASDLDESVYSVQMRTGATAGRPLVDKDHEWDYNVCRKDYGLESNF